MLGNNYLQTFDFFFYKYFRKLYLLSRSTMEPHSSAMDRIIDIFVKRKNR